MGATQLGRIYESSLGISPLPQPSSPSFLLLLSLHGPPFLSFILTHPHVHNPHPILTELPGKLAAFHEDAIRKAAGPPAKSAVLILVFLSSPSPPLLFCLSLLFFYTSLLIFFVVYTGGDQSGEAREETESKPSQSQSQGRWLSLVCLFCLF